MSDMESRSIFVSIAAYRDPDVMNTVADLYLHAYNPNRVFVGLCVQIDLMHDDPRPQLQLHHYVPASVCIIQTLT